MSVSVREGGGRGGDGGDLLGQRRGEADARLRRAVELPGPRLVGVPLAVEEALLLQPAQQRVQRVRVGRESGGCQLLEQAVAVSGRAQQVQARQDDGAAAQLLQVPVELRGFHTCHYNVSRTL